MTAGSPVRRSRILRISSPYSLGPTDTLFVDTGVYALFGPVLISGTVGIGDDQGFVMTGPAGGTSSAVLMTAVPAQPNL